MSYMPLKGLRLLLPFRVALWLVTVVPDDVQSIQRALRIFLFYFPLPLDTLSHIFLGSLCLLLLCVLPPAFLCCQTCCCMLRVRQPRCAHHLGWAAPAVSWSLQIHTECWSTAPPSPPSFPFFFMCAAFVLATDSFTYTRSAQLRKASKVPSSQGSNPSADGFPHPDGFTPSSPSPAPCGTRGEARKILECGSFQCKCSPLWMFSFLLLKYISECRL